MGRRQILDQGGQVLPITALFMTGMLLFAALAVDVTGVLWAERYYTTTSDAAALAGAQDLQQGTTRTVTAAERMRARTHSMRVLADQLDASGVPVNGNCDPTSDIIECSLPGTPYLVSVRTPSPECVDCDVDRAVKVTIRDPDHELTFARLAGQSSWNVESSAVAGLEFAGKYALIAMKPIDKNFQDGVIGNGTGTVVEVEGGDIGTNTNAELSGGALFELSDGYSIRYLDDSVGTQWGSTPPGVLNPSEILDPRPPEPSFLGADIFPEQSDGEVPCPAEVVDLDTVPDDVVCYAPGVYQAQKNNDQFLVNNNQRPTKAYLTSGVYKFEGGMDVSGELYGGLVPNEPGVTLYIPSDEELDANNAVVMRLNTGATPAVDSSGAVMQNDDGLLVTLYVPRIDSCFSGRRPVECSEEPSSEPDIKLAGDSALYIAGVIYAPTEAIGIRGGSSSNAIDGQVIGWTLEWSGGSTLNLNYPHGAGVGLLRLDAACTGTEACG